MRYESFYPFAHRPTRPISQQRFLPNTGRPFENTTQNTEQQFESLTNHIPAEQRGQGPSKLEHYMQTADRFLSTAQQFAPLIQQFAPMVSNLPSMWRLYKGFQSMPDRPPTSENRQPPTQTAPSFAQQESTQQRFTPSRPQPSTPKIFQPPNP